MSLGLHNVVTSKLAIYRSDNYDSSTDHYFVYFILRAAAAYVSRLVVGVHV